ncbi:MAG TPA: hypothetical protein VLK36_05940 [Gaiellaceae bacterium]|nr:hypothetical protein [Gaiellaceae bacterium]
MTSPPARTPRPRRRRRRLAPWLLGGAALLVAFVVGVALGEALHDNPQPGGTQTFLRTVTLAPSPVTITARNP